MSFHTVSFAAWPNAGEVKVTTWTDRHYQAVLKGKAYMMGVSPYFYTSEVPKH